MRFVTLQNVPLPECVSPFGGRVTIYALIDPRDDTVRYVGVTRRELQERLLQHLTFPTNKRTASWFADMLKDCHVPKIVGLCHAGRNWEIAEIEWIAWFRARGDLLNIDGGGRLVSSGTGLDEIKREKIRAIQLYANAHIDNRPPPCAQNHIPARSKRIRRRTRLESRRMRKAEKLIRERLADAERDRVHSLASIDPVIRKRATKVTPPER